MSWTRYLRASPGSRRRIASAIGAGVQLLHRDQQRLPGAVDEPADHRVEIIRTTQHGGPGVELDGAQVQSHAAPRAELGCSVARNGIQWRPSLSACDGAPVPELDFDERIAKRYEDLWPDLFEPAVVDPAVSFLADLAGTGAALELGIGTGRIALPLSRRGVRVHGIELSPAMVAQLRAKPGADEIGVTIGDFATTKVDGTFTLAYLVRNTITNLTTQDEQVACFRNVAAHLEPGGCFVIEVVRPGAPAAPAGRDHPARSP